MRARERAHDGQGQVHRGARYCRQPFDRQALDSLLGLADLGIKQLIDKQRAIVGHLVA